MCSFILTISAWSTACACQAWEKHSCGNEWWKDKVLQDHFTKHLQHNTDKNGPDLSSKHALRTHCVAKSPGWPTWALRWLLCKWGWIQAGFWEVWDLCSFSAWLMSNLRLCCYPFLRVLDMLLMSCPSWVSKVDHLVKYSCSNRRRSFMGSSLGIGFPCVLDSFLLKKVFVEMSMCCCYSLCSHSQRVGTLTWGLAQI